MSGYDPHSQAIESEIRDVGARCEKMLGEMGRRIVGQRQVGERLVMALIAEGHVLLEGLPGLAKTTSIKALGEVAHLAFKRVQFTPDLLPADVLGTQIYNPKDGTFEVKQGPVFTNLLLADEINRAPAKVQSSLLEAMQERQVTLGDKTFQLPKPFLVLATQNPIEQEGTYPLPEAQVDRFLFKVKVGYGTREEEEEIVKRAMAPVPVELEKVIEGDHILQMQNLVPKLHMADKVRSYAVQLVFATRDPKAAGLPELEKLIDCGASPRASIALEQAGRVNALMNGRGFVTPQDIKDVGYDVLRHRIILTYAAEAENIDSDEIIRRIFERVDVP